MTPKELMNEKKLSILEEAAKEYENKEIFVLDGEYTKESVINAFLAGAEWQKNNLWISVEEELPYADKPCFVITKNNKCSVSSMYIPKDCHGNVLGEKEWKGSLSFKESIVSWMPIPEFNIKT